MTAEQIELEIESMIKGDRSNGYACVNDEGMLELDAGRLTPEKLHAIADLLAKWQSQNPEQ